MPWAIRLAKEASINDQQKAAAERDARNAFRKVFAALAAFDAFDTMAPIEVVIHKIIVDPRALHPLLLQLKMKVTTMKDESDYDEDRVGR